MAEEARLESVYTPKAYPEFESRSLRKKEVFKPLFLGMDSILKCNFEIFKVAVLII